jgi:inner membrane protein
MPTIMTHAILPLAIAVAAGRSRISPKLALAGAALAMLPDADVVGFAIGIEYADPWGHRGATHAVAFAVMVTGVLALLWHEARSLGAFLFLAMDMASHGLLDALTSGGLGPALLWPVSDARIFAPITPIRVSPIGADFFTARGVVTLVSELTLVWLPCLALAAIGWLMRHRNRAPVK